MIGSSNRQDTAAVVVEQRRKRAEIVQCPACEQLICQDCSCSNCGVVFDRQGLIDLLVSVKARQPDPVFVA